MNSEKSFLEKYYLLIFYIIFLVADSILLYQHNYNYRLYAKPVLEPVLLLWFMSNTAFNIFSSPQTLWARLILYFIFTCTFAADVFGLSANNIVWLWCLFLYSLSYLFYFFLFISIQKNTPAEKHFYIYVSKAVPVFLIILSLGFVFLIKVLDLDLSLSNIWFFIHAFVIALAGGMVANMWGVPELKSIRLLFATGVLFLIITNVVYGIDEQIYQRRHSVLDVFVALSNGTSQVLIILGTIKFVAYKVERLGE